MYFLRIEFEISTNQYVQSITYSKNFQLNPLKIVFKSMSLICFAQ